MWKRKKKIISDQSDSASGQSDDDNHDNKHNTKDAAMESLDTSASKQLLLEKIAIYKLMQKNKFEDGKAMTREARLKSSNEFPQSTEVEEMLS